MRDKTKVCAKDRIQKSQTKIPSKSRYWILWSNSEAPGSYTKAMKINISFWKWRCKYCSIDEDTDTDTDIDIDIDTQKAIGSQKQNFALSREIRKNGKFKKNSAKKIAGLSSFILSSILLKSVD